MFYVGSFPKAKYTIGRPIGFMLPRVSMEFDKNEKFKKLKLV